MSYVLVFVGMFALDWIWARYNMACASHQPMSASVNALLIMLLNGVVTVAYVNDPWLLIPAALGAFAGTYASIWQKDRHEITNPDFV